jgi:hypothetical protein
VPEPNELKILKIHQMIILSALRYGCTAYGSASKALLSKLDPIHHRVNLRRVQNRKRIMQEFQELVNEQYNDHTRFYTDGSKTEEKVGYVDTKKDKRPIINIQCGTTNKKPS